MFRPVVLALLGCLLLAGCFPVVAPHYQAQESVPHNQWKYDFRPVFKFAITDTNARYKPYFIIQHTQAYPYSNLWMWMYIKSPGDSLGKKTRVNIIMADAGGKWLGRGMGAIYEERVYLKLNDVIPFNRAGAYEIMLEQNMRLNPLPEVLHVGLRVEKEPRR